MQALPFPYSISGFLQATLFVGALSVAAAADSASPEDIEYFEKNIRPVLAENCYVCHGPQLQQKGLRLDSREAVLKGGARGPALVPGEPGLSLLMRVVRHEGLVMPPAGKLQDGQIAALEKWIAMGAPWPKEAAQPLETGDPGFYEQITREHWSFQPVAKPDVPAVRDAAWSGHPVDRFILASQEEKGLHPSEPAGRRTLARRLSFVLTGLPPTPAEVKEFVADPSPKAYERLAGRLLESPHFGEHWARHWMDVMRFAETFGNDWNYELHGAWHYRDYLIRAFNGDVPYDQLVREHIAGDLLENPRINHQEGINESSIGPAFYRLGEQGHDDCILFREVRTDVVDNQIDTLGKAFQGLTIACARCHDHKLDPIPTKDYYALYGVLSSSRLMTRTLDTPAVRAEPLDKLQALKPRIREDLAARWLAESRHIGERLQDAFTTWKSRPEPEASEEEKEEEPSKEERDEDDEKKKEKKPPKKLFENEKMGMEDPLFPWVAVTNGEPGPGVTALWAQLKKRYEKDSASRAAFNREYFEPFSDFRGGSLEGWYRDGHALAPGASPSGEFAVAPEGHQAVTGLLPAGVHTHLLSEKLNAALHSPYVPGDKHFISIQVLGGKLSAWRATLDNCMLSEDYAVLDSDSMSWIRIPTKFEKHTYPFYVELVTRSDNPRIPDRPKRLPAATPELMGQPRSYFGIARAVLHDCEAVPEDELTHMARLFEGPAPSTLEELGERYAAAARQALQAWAGGTASDDDVRWINWLLSDGLLANSRDSSARLAALIGEYRAIEAEIAEPRVVYSMGDLDNGSDYPVFKRGDPKNLGDTVPRGFLELITKSDKGFETRHSGRREIAEAIADPRNPLTARVFVNRLWHYVFGRGIVSTTDNFGRVGDKPTHPELLDYLASRFVEQGWSIKGIIKHLVLSKTFQQSSVTTEASVRADPANRLLSHFPVRRLEAESIRDAILATSGRLDRTLYGPSTQPFREDPQEYRKLFSGPLDGMGRRGIYTKVTRHEGDRFLELFDFPNPGLTRGRRDTTNVASQALALLNNGFVIDQAEVWAERAMENDAADPEARIRSMFDSAFGRPPEGGELSRLRGLAAELASLHGAGRDGIMDSREVWKDVAHAIFNMKEFIYIR